MSAEKTITDKQNPSDLSSLQLKNSEISSRVNINHLLARVREEEKKTNKTNFFFFIMVIGLVVASALIFSF